MADSVELGPLPGGHHGLSREQVAESQRERLLAAIATVVVEQGYRGATITAIAKRASVANRVFYENFQDKEAAFLATFDAVYEHLTRLIKSGLSGTEGWAQGVIVALRTALEFFAVEPDLARLTLVAPFTATPRIVERFLETISEVSPYLRAGRAVRPEGARLPASTEDGVLGGLISITARSVINGERPLPDLLPDLVEFVLGPYLGAETAKRLASEASGGK
jgi:AcrR family transcriptional regulator